MIEQEVYRRLKSERLLSLPFFAVLPISASGNTRYEVTQASRLWSMAAALGLHREVALPVPLHKGLRPLYSSVLPFHPEELSDY